MCGWPISRVLSKGPILRPPPLDDHSSARTVTSGVKLPTRTSGLKYPCGGVPVCTGRDPTRGPYSALLRVGLAIPSRLPGPWWALTPPFHHHRGLRPGRTPDTTAVFSLWRFPSGYPGRALPGTLSSWSPDFPRVLPPAVIQPSARAGIRPIGPFRQRQTDPPNPPSSRHPPYPDAPWPKAGTAAGTLPTPDQHPYRRSQTGTHQR